MTNWLSNLFVKEVSLVDRPANPGAVVLLTKRDETDEEIDKKITFEHKKDGTTRFWHEADGNAPEGQEAPLDTKKRDISTKERHDMASKGQALPDGSFPIANEEDLHNAVRLVGNAKEPAKAKRHIISRAKAMGLTNALPKDWEVTKSLAETTSSVLTRATTLLRKSVDLILGSDQHMVLLDKTFSEFQSHVQSEMAASGEADSASSADPEGNDNSGVSKQKEDEEMATQEEMLALKKKADDEAAALVKSLDDLKAEVAFLKMSPEHQAFAKDMPADKKKAFAGKDAKDRDSEVADCAKRAQEQVPESVRKALEEAAITKRDNEALAKRVAELEARDETEALTKRATDIGMTAADVDTLRKARKGDVEAVKKLEDRIQALAKQVKESALFKEYGSGLTHGGNAYDQIKARADELRKGDPKLSAEAAFEKAYTDPANKELVTLYKREQKSAAA